MDTNTIKRNIIASGYKAINELIKVAEEAIILDSESDLTADKLKNAASAKRLAIFDSFEILKKIKEEEDIIDGKETIKEEFMGFAERKSLK